MRINSVDMDQFLGGAFSRPLREVRLTQRTSEQPRIFSGPGSIDLSNGEIKVSIYHEYVGDEKNQSMRSDFSMKAGEIIRDDSYYSMVATDINGGQWSCESLSLGGEFGVHSAFIVASSNSAVTVGTNTKTSAEQLTYWMRGEQPVPLGMPDHRVTIPYAGGAVVLRNENGNSALILSGGAATPERGEGLIQALEIMFGRMIQVVAIHRSGGQGAVLELYPYDSELQNTAMPTPIHINRPGGAAAFQSYLISVSSFLVEEQWVAGYWHKVNRVWQAGLINAGLSITVSIEGLLKALYVSNGVDEEFAGMASAAVPLVQDLKLEERVKNRLITSLSTAGGFSAKAALKSLSKNPFFHSSAEADWSALRNAAAHADRTDSDPRARQKLVSRTFANLRLFYDLIAWRAGYRGRRVDYSTLGFPVLEVFEPADESHYH